MSDNVVNVVELPDSPEINIARAWVFHDDVFILKSDDDHLYMSVEGVYYCKYDTCDLLQCHVTAAHVYLNILCLGSNTGHVYLYLLKDPVDVLHLDLVHPDHRVHVSGDQGSVMSISMSVYSDNGHQVHNYP